MHSMGQGSGQSVSLASVMIVMGKTVDFGTCLS